MKRVFDYSINRKTTIRNYLNRLHISKDIICALKKRPNDILINGIHRNVDYVADEGDILSLILYEKDDKIIPSPISVEIVYEDEDILLISKPCGMPVHPSRFHPDDSLANALAYIYRDEGFVFHCINRLDSDTSGLVLIGKNRLAASFLNSSPIHKEYLAILEGELAQKTDIDAPIARMSGSIKREVSPLGDAATTHFKPIKYYKDKNCTLVRCILEHGRTHQIRVHAQHIHHPLIGDRLYNPSDTSMNRQALHCDTMDFVHPFTQKELHFHIDLEADMKSFLGSKFC